MKFLTPKLEAEFAQLHPDVRFSIIDLDDWSAASGLPEVVITHVNRTEEQQEAIYWKQIQKAEGLREKEAREKARKKFSWHRVRCAVDLRNKHYTKQQRGQVVLRLMQGRTKGPWEILEHDVGRGDHIHVGRRDFAFRVKVEAEEKKNVGLSRK